MLIKTTKFSDPQDYYTNFPWEGRIDGIQGGTNGFVVVRGGESYRTAFVEVQGGEIDFIRGEGETIAKAEERAWAIFKRNTSCPGHEYEPRGCKNGAGFCQHCNQFAVKVFTAEQLGLRCVVCNVYANHYWDSNGVYCREHSMHPGAVFRREHGISEDEWFERTP